MRIEDLKQQDVGRWVQYTAPHGEKKCGRIKSWNDKFIFVVYNCADNWDKFLDYTAAATEPNDLQVFLDMDILKDLPKHEIFATGTLPDSQTGLFMTGSDKELRWVATAGEIGDWTIYCHFSHNSAEWVKRFGDKVCSKIHVLRCVSFEDDAVFGMYRL